MAITAIVAVLLLASASSSSAAAAADDVLMVPLTLIPLQPEDSSSAVCLDGTPPGYHLHKGWGSGAHSWVVHLEGGGWCNTLRSCVFRKTTRRGSSSLMEKQLPFTGILSNDPQRNPDFFNWNRLKLRYCDGASFSGDSFSKEPLLHFRGRRIWEAAMRHLVVDKGMAEAQQALLSGCSAGGLAAIIHCDDFRGLFGATARVKCLSDAGLFLDAADVSGGHTLRSLYSGVVSLQQVRTAAGEGAAQCFFPQNLIGRVSTPLFLLNSAYDAWQLQASLAPPSADPTGSWAQCKLNHALCNSSQLGFLQDFREQMVGAVKAFSLSPGNGLFINSCFAHCQSERQDTWFADDSPLLGNKPVAVSVGDWFFQRATVKAIDCPYPCDTTCHNLVFKKDEYSDTTTTAAAASEGFLYVTYSAAIVTALPLIGLLILCFCFNLSTVIF